MSDRIFKNVCLVCAALAAVLMLAFFVQLAFASGGAWKAFGWRFLVSTEWDPVAGHFGALPAIAGTLATTAIALLLATPPAFAAALFVVDAPPWLARPLGQAVDLLAAIPSVIYGMWGLFVLCPIVQRGAAACGIETTGFGLFTAGLVLALMILPYICAVMRDVLKMTPPVLREAAFGIGCTRWETAKDILIRSGRAGLLGGILIGLGRALGETMAVLFVAGGLNVLPKSLFAGCTTIAATLANDFAEADGVHRAALFALGLVLLFLSFIIQVAAQAFLTRGRRAEGAK